MWDEDDNPVKDAEALCAALAGGRSQQIPARFSRIATPKPPVVFPKTLRGNLKATRRQDSRIAKPHPLAHLFHDHLRGSRVLVGERRVNASISVLLLPRRYRGASPSSPIRRHTHAQRHTDDCVCRHIGPVSPQESCAHEGFFLFCSSCSFCSFWCPFTNPAVSGCALSLGFSMCLQAQRSGAFISHYYFLDCNELSIFSLRVRLGLLFSTSFA